MVGGLLLTQRPIQAPAPDATPIAASPDEAASTGPAGDLSPRTGHGDRSASDPAVPSPEAAALGLPGDLSLAELFPAEVAMGAVADAAGPIDAGAAGTAVAAGYVGDDSGGGSDSRWPLMAGMVVALAILVWGGGWLWWRNRESAYWPA